MKDTPARILILGGYGRAGNEIADLLVQHTSVTVTLAGRQLAQAQASATQLNQNHHTQRVKGIAVDITQPPAVAAAFADCDLVIMAVPFRGDAAEIVLTTALEAGIDYIDINTDSGKHAIFAQQRDRIQHSQQIFLTEAGIIPGCPSVLVRWAIENSNNLKSFTVGSLMRDPQMPAGSVYDIMSHADKPAEIYRDGQWQSISPLALRSIDFGSAYGNCWCIPVSLPELKALPQQIPLHRLAVYQADVNAIADAIFLLWQALGLNRFEQGLDWGVRLFQWANQRFTPPPYGITLILESEHQRLLWLHHDDVYRGTAIPVVAAVQQLLSDQIQRPWQGFMGQGVRPEPFMNSLRELGLAIQHNDS